jgi:hypothetical protein
MPEYVTRSGEVLEWAGAKVCICSKCEEIFGSPYSFDMHIVDHDHLPPESSGLVRNRKGWWVSGLRDADSF